MAFFVGADNFRHYINFIHYCYPNIQKREDKGFSVNFNSHLFLHNEQRVVYTHCLVVITMSNTAQMCAGNVVLSELYVLT